MDIKILSRLLGHADVNITYNVYIHLFGDGFDEMYEALCKKISCIIEVNAFCVFLCKRTLNRDIVFSITFKNGWHYSNLHFCNRKELQKVCSICIYKNYLLVAALVTQSCTQCTIRKVFLNIAFILLHLHQPPLRLLLLMCIVTQRILIE